MGIDLFGQSSDRLPTPTAIYRRGPDWQHGPPRCRQNQQLCEYDQKQPHDHSCCCDPCRHNFVNVCAGAGGPSGCCRCVLKAICMTFIPDTPTATCTTKTWKLDQATITGKGSSYSTTLGDMGEVEVFVGFPELNDPLFDVASCVWRLTIADPATDESVAVDHSGDIHCQAPPDWAITGVTITQHGEACVGTITFAPYKLEKLPFINKWWELGDEFIDGLACGTCSQFCRALCVKRLTNGEYTRVDFIWNDAYQFWGADDNSGHAISLVSDGYDCYLELESIGGGEFEGNLLLIDPMKCSLGMDLTATSDYSSDTISISCNRCSCWKYICGTCRCVCESICIVGVIDNVFQEPIELPWDAQNFRWGDDNFSVQLSSDESDNCQVTVTGFSEPVAIRNDCGSRIVFVVSDTTDEMNDSGLVNYLYGWCKQCEGSCTQGSCLDICEEVPQVLYCYLNAAPWTEMLGCNQYVLCFEPIVIPLALVFVGTEAAGEWRWIGCGIISCYDCNPPTAKKNYLVCVDLGCDGVGAFQVSRADITAQCLVTFGFTLPCGSYDTWDITFTAECDGLNGCCFDGGFQGRITE